MADIETQLLAVFHNQAAEGTIDPGIAALASPLDESDGIVWGSPAHGRMESGIEFTISGQRQEQGRGHAGRANHSGDFIRTLLDAFTLTWQFGGPMATASTPPVDADFAFLHDPDGIAAIFSCAGLWPDDAPGSGLPGVPPSVGQVYRHEMDGTTTQGRRLDVTSARIYESGRNHDLFDLRADLKWELAVGDAPVCAATFSGNYSDADSGATAFPTVDVDGANMEQYTESVLLIDAITLAYGGMTCYVNTATITLSNNVSQVGPTANNQLWNEGVSEVAFDIEIVADSADPTFDMDQIINPGPLDFLQLTIGVAATDGVITKSWQLCIAACQVEASTPSIDGTKLTFSLTGKATNDIENNEVLMWIAFF